MKSYEFRKLREELQKELNRRKRINELLGEDLVKEYLMLRNISANFLDIEDYYKILDEILKGFKITQTNGIYVCTCAYYIDWRVCYEETDYYTVETLIDSKKAEYRVYTDIESGKKIQARKENDEYHNYLLMKDFERDNIILNPTNRSKNENNYEEVRQCFWEQAIKLGQAKSKKLILNKYSRL